MKMTKHLAIGLAITFGLVACSRDSQKSEAPQAIDIGRSLGSTAANTDANTDLSEKFTIMSDAERQNLENEISTLKGNILQKKTDIQDLQKQIVDQPENESKLQTSYKELVSSLDDLIKQYSERRTILVEDDIQKDLYQLLQDEGLASLDQLPQTFTKVKANVNQEIEQAKGQEGPLQAQMSQAETQFKYSVSNLQNLEMTLRTRADGLKAQGSLAPAQEEELIAIQSYLEAASKRSELEGKAMAMDQDIKQLKDAIYLSQHEMAGIQAQFIEAKMALEKIEASAEDARAEAQEKVSKLESELARLDLNQELDMSKLQKSQDIFDQTRLDYSTAVKNLEEARAKLSPLTPEVTADASFDQMKEAQDSLDALHEQEAKWYSEINGLKVNLDKIEVLETYYQARFTGGSVEQTPTTEQQTPVVQQTPATEQQTPAVQQTPSAEQKSPSTKPQEPTVEQKAPKTQQVPQTQETPLPQQTAPVNQQKPTPEKQTTTSEVQAPVTQQQKPTTEQQAPVAQQQPATEQQAPVAQQQKPTTEQQAPVAQQQKPTTEQQAPVAQQQPATEQQAPVAQQQKPTTEQQAPVAQQQPATEQQAPVAQQQPATEQQAPVAQQQPATEQQAPVAQQQPATEQQAPVAQQQPVGSPVQKSPGTDEETPSESAEPPVQDEVIIVEQESTKKDETIQIQEDSTAPVQTTAAAPAQSSQQIGIMSL